MYPDTAYLARPEPIHAGDLDARGFSNVLLVSEGYRRWRALSGGHPGQAELQAAPMAANWAQTAGAGALVLILVALWLDGRITGPSLR